MSAEEPEATDEDQSAPVAKLFGEWDISDIEYKDPSTARYLTVTPIAHTMGRHANKQFQKSEISIVEHLHRMFIRPGFDQLERLTNDPGRPLLRTRVLLRPHQSVDQALDDADLGLLELLVRMPPHRVCDGRHGEIPRS